MKKKFTVMFLALAMLTLVGFSNSTAVSEAKSENLKKTMTIHNDSNVVITQLKIGESFVENGKRIVFRELELGEEDQLGLGGKLEVWVIAGWEFMDVQFQGKDRDGNMVQGEIKKVKVEDHKIIDIVDAMFE